MRSNAARAAIAAGLIAVAVALFVVLQPSDEESSEQPARPEQPAQTRSGTPAKQAKPQPPPAETITVRQGQPAGGVRTLEYRKGEQVRLEVRSDVADEVHVHGYDLMKEVAAGDAVTFDFPATIDGVFEIEVEGSHTQLAELRVEP